jgi:hypothetical protein
MRYPSPEDLPINNSGRLAMFAAILRASSGAQLIKPRKNGHKFFAFTGSLVDLFQIILEYSGPSLSTSASACLVSFSTVLVSFFSSAACPDRRAC